MKGLFRWMRRKSTRSGCSFARRGEITCDVPSVSAESGGTACLVSTLGDLSGGEAQ